MTDIVTITAAARITNLSTDTIRREIENGTLPTTDDDKVTRRALNVYIATHLS